MKRLLFTLVISSLLIVSCSQKSGPKPLTYEENKSLWLKKNPMQIPEEDKKVIQKSMQSLQERMPDPGLALGTLAPDFKLKDHLGIEHRLSDELKKGPVVLVFYRGAWCPYCNLYLKTLSDHQRMIEKKGAQIIAISPQKPDFSFQQVEEKALKFLVLSDLDYQTIKAYQIHYQMDEALLKVYKKFGIDLDSTNGEGRTALPISATFVIGQDHKIKAKHAKVDYKERMPIKEILSAL